MKVSRKLLRTVAIKWEEIGIFCFLFSPTGLTFKVETLATHEKGTSNIAMIGARLGLKVNNERAWSMTTKTYPMAVVRQYIMKKTLHSFPATDPKQTKTTFSYNLLVTVSYSRQLTTVD